MNTEHIKDMFKVPNNGIGIKREIPKISLKAVKVSVRKIGMNSGITGGGYQCC